jgi:HK97 family phage major capsid protein
MPIISRSGHEYTAPDGSKSGLIPVSYSNQIIQAAVERSLALNTFRRVTMPSSVTHMPVLDALPIANWVTGEPNDTDGTGGEKTPTSQAWKGLVLTAEEIAAIVVIPEAVIEDTTINLWDEITPRLGESVGQAIDQAVFAGTSKPASWPAAIIPAAIAASQETISATPDATDFNAAIGQVEAAGYFPDQVYASLGMRATFRGFNASNVPIYLTDVRDDGRVDSIYGIDVMYDRLGALGSNTHAVIGDPSMAIIGVRTDLQYKLLEEATLDVSAAQDGSAMVSLAQQDALALRVRGRFAFAVANPVNRVEPVEANRYPFSVISAT